MRKATYTTLRYLAMLRCIPVYPRTKSTRRILEELREKDSEYDVSMRSVQRSLEQLSGDVFPITCEMRGRANHWFWSEPHALTQIPSMSASTAFALRLAADYLKPIMPPSGLKKLAPYFKHADSVLDGTELGRWKDKAAIINQGPVLKVPNVPADVQETVYTALLKNRKIDVAYRAKTRARAKRIELNPLGIVVRAGIVYLVATSWNYDDIRHYALHRMSKPKGLADPARPTPGFRLATYIKEENHFSYPISDAKLRLRILFDKGAALHLMESRLATDHKTTEQQDGRVLVEATVPDTADLRWWLRGFGSNAEVLEPASLRDEFRDEAMRLRALYP